MRVEGKECPAEDATEHGRRSVDDGILKETLDAATHSSVNSVSSKALYFVQISLLGCKAIGKDFLSLTKQLRQVVIAT